MKVKLKFKKPGPALIAAVAILLVLSIATLLVLNTAAETLRAETDALREEAHQQELLADRLKQRTEELGTVPGIIQVARELLGLVPPDTIIFETEPTN